MSDVNSGASGTIDAVLRASASRWPERPLFDVLPNTAQVYGITPGPMSYADVLAGVADWADRLRAAGYLRGMRVALLLENRPEFFLIWLALNRLGASVVPINPDLRASELEYLIDHAEPALIITIETRVNDLQLAADQTPVEVRVVTPEADLPTPRSHAVVTRTSEDDEQRETAVLYTSGTTGNPKGCVLANSYFLELGDWYTALDGVVSLTTAGERMITPLPIFHMNAMACSFMAMLKVGGCLIALDRFHPRSWWQDVRMSRATCLHYLGVMPSMLIGAEALAQDREHQVRFGFGAGVDPKIHAAFESRFGFPLMEAWAMTETGAGAVISAHAHDRLVGQSALGPAPRWLDVQLIADDGSPVATGEPGELLVRRKGVAPRRGFFSEYYKDKQATDDAWADGWFHTGDIVREGDDGNVFFVDRKKNVIRRSGENIAAVDVESVLRRHPDVVDVGVTSVSDEVRGDEVFACLVVDSPSPELADAIVTWSLRQMAYYKVPGFITFVAELPLTATQKVQRAALRELAQTLLRDPETIDIRHRKKRQTHVGQSS